MKLDNKQAYVLFVTEKEFDFIWPGMRQKHIFEGLPESLQQGLGWRITIPADKSKDVVGWQEELDFSFRIGKRGPVIRAIVDADFADRLEEWVEEE